MNYQNEYYKSIYIDNYLYKTISKWLSIRLEENEKEQFANDDYSEEDYHRDMEMLKKTTHKEELLYLISSDYARLCIRNILNHLRSGSLDDIPSLVLYGQIPHNGFQLTYTKAKIGDRSFLESPVFRHIEEDLFRTTKENRDFYVRKLIGIIVDINQRYSEKTNRLRIKMRKYKSTNFTFYPSSFHIQSAQVNRQLLDNQRTNLKLRSRLLFDVRYFKVKIYKLLWQFDINLIDIARKYNAVIFYEYELHLLENIQQTNTNNEEELIEEVQKSIEIENLKPRITVYNKPQLNKNQVTVLFNVLKQCEILNKEVMRQAMDTGISLLTGYSEKQIHKGTNTPINEILNTKESITQIQNLLEKAIEILEKEKKEINR